MFDGITDRKHLLNWVKCGDMAMDLLTIIMGVALDTDEIIGPDSIECTLRGKTQRL